MAEGPVLKIRVYVEGKLLAEGEVPGPLVAMPAKIRKGKEKGDGR